MTAEGREGGGGEEKATKRLPPGSRAGEVGFWRGGATRQKPTLPLEETHEQTKRLSRGGLESREEGECRESREKESQEPPPPPWGGCWGDEGKSERKDQKKCGATLNFYRVNK